MSFDDSGTFVSAAGEHMNTQEKQMVKLSILILKREITVLDYLPIDEVNI